MLTNNGGLKCQGQKLYSFPLSVRLVTKVIMTGPKIASRLAGLGCLRQLFREACGTPV